MAPRISLPRETLALAAAVVIMGGCGSSSSPPPPGGPPFKLSDFSSPETCQGCHPVQYDEWEGSMHAYSFKDELFFAMSFAEHQHTGGALGQFCIGCHSPIGTLTGTTPNGVFDPTSMPDVVRAGISCDLCHSIIHGTPGATEAGTPLALRPGNIKFGPLPAFQGSFHGTQQVTEYEESGICRACHNLTVRGIKVEETFDEWENSLYASRPDHCQKCHMPEYGPGYAAVAGADSIPLRQKLHHHTFIGVDVALTDFPDRQENLDRAAALLRGSASLYVAARDTAVAGDTVTVSVTVDNDRTGHSLPSGTSFSRQMWIEIVATDATQNTIYISGDLDANGDLRDRNSALDPNGDPDLVNYTTVLEGGDDVTVFSATGIQNRLIPPLESRTAVYRVPTLAGTPGPIHVAVRLRFRPFPPFKARRLGRADLVPEIPIFEMAAASRDIVLR